MILNLLVTMALILFAEGEGTRPIQALAPITTDDKAVA
jgi:hypothetical protein|tara:strand:- start:712 stop:825 length:114 start_codon:yes stop_codon:yes gene_type:complete